MKLLKPTFILKSVNDIDISFILNNKYKLIIFDMNNTLIDYYTTDICDKTKDLIQKLKENNITMYILTNSLSKKQVSEISKILDIPYINRAFKPFPFRIKSLIKKININKENCILIGDHLVTDVLVANLCNISSILVEPINKQEKLHSKLARKFENIILKNIPK